MNNIRIWADIVDLHIHTKYSDGTDDVNELLEKIYSNDIEIFSVTDHDNVDFYKNLDYNKLNGLKLIPGIEFSCKTEAGKCHILGYGIDVNNPVLMKTIAEVQKRKRNKLKYLTRIFGSDNGEIDAKVAIDSIIAAGGVPVWAHPLGEVGEKSVDIHKFDTQLNCLVERGIMGIECYYSGYNEEDYNFIIFRLIENDYFQRLYLSGGSDYHGKAKNIELGTLNVEHKDVPRIRFTILSVLKLESFIRNTSYKYYEYDKKYQVLINTGGAMYVIEKEYPVWRELGPEYEQYARAICRGQGCWERLDSVTEEQAQEILKSWGYVSLKDRQQKNADIFRQ